MDFVTSLWQAPKINSVNNKARSIPAFNPFNLYGRIFLVSSLGFFVSFLSWYAFPPLLTDTIKQDLNLTAADVANSNVISLVATLLVRVTAGSACDRFGARWTFIACLVTGAIPTALAGTVSSAQGLIVIRFFVGIVGGSFIPCQVWVASFFDKNVVGTATAWTAGLGNAGGGVTYFVMPAIFNSLVSQQDLSPHAAWRVAFVVPFIIIIATALLMIFTCPDTPTGKWSDRSRTLQRNLDTRDTFFSPGRERKAFSTAVHTRGFDSDDTIKLHGHDSEAQAQEEDLLAAASWELVEKPTYHGTFKAVFSLPTLTLIATYFCSFGAELSINSFLGVYYRNDFPSLGQTGSGKWAAMFGLLNVLFRPAGGMMSDAIYRSRPGLWGKKILIHVLGIFMGAFLLVIGFLKPNTEATLFGLFAGLAFFIEAGNGAVFSLVQHVHPTSNGLITGVTGAAGDLGGIVFLLVARYSDTNYSKALWIIGAICIGINLSVAWIRPIPKGQLGGR